MLLSKGKHHLLIYILIITILYTSMGFAYANEEDTITIGVLSFDSKQATLVKWQPLADYLSMSIDGLTFEILPLFYSDFDEAIRTQSIDYILTNPAHFIRIGQSFDLSGAIATLTELSDGKPQSGFGGVIFTKNANDSPKSLLDLKGKTISAVSESSLGGYQASAFELKKIGLNLSSDVEFQFTGMPHSNSIDMVLSGQADAGFVRSGVIEKLISEGSINENDIRILNQQSVQGFDQELSTVLYPEWPFIALTHMQPRQAQKVAASLFLLDDYPEYTEAMGIYGFTIPASYLDVELLMRSLNIDPFNFEESITLIGIWRQYYFEVILTLGFIIILISYTVYKSRVGRILSAKNLEMQHLTDELQKTNENLTEISIKDSLTGLYNRRHFELFLEDKLHQIERYKSSIAVCVIDIDNFKYYNDTYGHDIGDLVLVEVARTLQNQVQRSLDLVARYAGDEFIIILHDINHEGLELVANRIVGAIDDLRIFHPNKDVIISVSISMGITTTSHGCHQSSNEVFREADSALFKAKDKGKNCYVIRACHCDNCQ